MRPAFLGAILLAADPTATCEATHAVRQGPDGRLRLEFSVPSRCACVPSQLAALEKFEVAVTGPSANAAGPKNWALVTQRDSSGWRLTWTPRSSSRQGSVLTFSISGAAPSAEAPSYQSHSAHYGECVVAGVRGVAIY
jgi:hypothetical protein